MTVFIGIHTDAFFIALLTWCAYTDIRTRTVSNASVLLLLCLGLTHTVLMALSEHMWWTYPSGIVMAVPLFALWLRGGIGAGDVKLIICIGLYLGVLNMLIAFAFMIPALAIIMARYWIKAKTFKCSIPLAPVLAIGAIGALALKYLYTLIQI